MKSTVFFRPTGSGELFPSSAEEVDAADDDLGFDEAAHFAQAQWANVFDRDPQLSVSASTDDWVPGNSALREGAQSLAAPYASGTGFYGAFKVGVTPWTDGWIALPEN